MNRMEREGERPREPPNAAHVYHFAIRATNGKGHSPEGAAVYSRGWSEAQPPGGPQTTQALKGREKGHDILKQG